MQEDHNNNEDKEDQETTRTEETKEIGEIVMKVRIEEETKEKEDPKEITGTTEMNDQEEMIEKKIADLEGRIETKTPDQEEKTETKIVLKEDIRMKNNPDTDLDKTSKLKEESQLKRDTKSVELLRPEEGHQAQADPPTAGTLMRGMIVRDRRRGEIVVPRQADIVVMMIDREPIQNIV